MTIRTVAFVPAAPLLVTPVAGGSAPEDAELRNAALTAIARATAGVGEVVVVAGVEPAGEWQDNASWDFTGFGVPRRPADPRTPLPWPLGIGAWMLDEAGWAGPRCYLGVGSRSAAVDPVAADVETALVVVGDGSARGAERAPGYLDERAEGFDRAVAGVLADGDLTGLGAIDAALAGELMCCGVAAWHWVAAALAGSTVTAAELITDTAPYGVRYFVALWTVG